RHAREVSHEPGRDGDREGRGSDGVFQVVDHHRIVAVGERHERNGLDWLLAGGANTAQGKREQRKPSGDRSALCESHTVSPILRAGAPKCRRKAAAARSRRSTATPCAAVIKLDSLGPYSGANTIDNVTVDNATVTVIYSRAMSADPRYAIGDLADLGGVS